MAVKIVSEEIKQKIFDEWIDDDNSTKAGLGRKYGVSAKTISRIIDELNVLTPYVSNKVVNDTYILGGEELYDYHEYDEYDDLCDDDDWGDDDVDDSVTTESDYKFRMNLTDDVSSIEVFRIDPEGEMSSVIVYDNSDPIKFDEAKSILLASTSQENLKEIFKLLDIKTFIEENMKDYKDGSIEVLPRQGKVIYRAGGNEVYTLSAALSFRLLDAVKIGKPEKVQNLFKFVDKMMDNPRKEIIQELYDFLQAGDIEIDDDGDVIAFKLVKENYTDCYTGTMDNSPGKVVEMKRAFVDSDSSQTCSAGLHCCSAAYLGSYCGDRIIRLKINPADFVSIPYDYYSNDSGTVKAKARVCKYLVLDDVTETMSRYR